MLKFSNTGNLVWSKKEISGAIITDLIWINDALIIAGYAGQPSFKIDTVNINSDKNYNLFITKTDSLGTVKWVSLIKNNQGYLTFYANPNTGLCNIKIPTEFEHERSLKLFVYDQQGRLLKEASIEMEAEKIKLNLEALAKGMYTAVISNGKKKYSGKIIFQ